MDDQNIYAAPKSDLTPEANSNDEALIQSLKHQSTFRFLILTIVTIGIYTAHYNIRQTRVLNEYLDDKNKISNIFVYVTLVIYYVSVALLSLYFFVDETTADGMTSIFDLVSAICLLVWAFKARNSMNILLKVRPGQKQWLHGFWTFIFQSLYFNYKVNKLSGNNP